MHWYIFVVLMLLGIVAWCYLKLAPGPRSRRAQADHRSVGQRAGELVKSRETMNAHGPMNKERRRKTPKPIQEFDRP